MNLFERTEAKLKIAVRFLESLKEVSENTGKEKLATKIDKCLNDIKKI